MLEKIDVKPNDWTEVAIPAGNYSLVNQGQEVVYISEESAPTNLREQALVLSNFCGSPNAEKIVYVKSKYANTNIFLVDFRVRS